MKVFAVIFIYGLVCAMQGNICRIVYLALCGVHLSVRTKRLLQSAPTPS